MTKAYLKSRITQPFRLPGILKDRLYTKSQERSFAVCRDAAHVTYCCCRNMGDTVLSQCVRKTLGKLCGVNTYRIIPVNKSVTEKTVADINRTSLLVIGGGGLFLPDTNKNNISGWQWAIPPALLEKIAVPVAIYSVGYNYFRGQTPNALFEENLRRIVAKSSFVGLRNTGSCRAVKAILGDDLGKSIVFQPCTTTLIRKIYTDIPPKKQTGRIGINMAFDRENLRYGDDEDIVLSQVAQAMKELVARGYELFCVAHCHADLKFLPYLRNENVKFTPVDMSAAFPHTAFDFYNSIDCMFGMRGHAQMIPFGLNCSVISLGSHEKMRWFLEDIDATDWYVELRRKPRSLKTEIIDTFSRVHERDGEKTRSRLLAAQDRLWDITLRNAETIRTIRSCA